MFITSNFSISSLFSTAVATNDLSAFPLSAPKSINKSTITIKGEDLNQTPN